MVIGDSFNPSHMQINKTSTFMVFMRRDPRNKVLFPILMSISPYCITGATPLARPALAGGPGFFAGSAGPRAEKKLSIARAVEAVA